MCVKGNVDGKLVVEHTREVLNARIVVRPEVEFPSIRIIRHSIFVPIHTLMELIEDGVEGVGGVYLGHPRLGAVVVMEVISSHIHHHLQELIGKSRGFSPVKPMGPHCV